MNNKNYRFALLIGLIILFVVSLNFQGVQAQEIMQQPTGSIPTVTGTPRGVIATVYLDQEESINVRSGPGTLYDIVGVLLPGQDAAVKGRTSDGDWLLVDYPGAPDNQGWIYTNLVSLTPGEVSIVEIPPTVTPLVTETINPTLAAQFITTPIPTRLATYTPVEPLGGGYLPGSSAHAYPGRHPDGIDHLDHVWNRKHPGANFLHPQPLDRIQSD